MMNDNKRKILVADDIRFITKTIERVLQNDGHHVDTCENGSQAIEKLKQGHYDLVITDIIMPEKDGIEVSKYVREQSNHSDTPIIAITGGGITISTEIAVEAAYQHANAVLLKPFNMTALRETVGPYLKNREQSG